MTEKNTLLLSLEDSFLNTFDQKIFSQARLNLLFALVVLGEVVSMLLMVPFFIQSALLAFMLAVLVLTIFGYLLLRQYLESQKLTFFKDLLEKLLSPLKTSSEAEQLVELAKFCIKIADKLYQREYGYFPLPKRLRFLQPWNEFLSCWLYWFDIHSMRELLLEEAVEAHLQIVRSAPTNPDAHALLANAYVMLSSIYIDPRKSSSADSERWIPKAKMEKKMQAQFVDKAQKAIEEFKILKEYAPNDPWVYMQLAYSYRDLQMSTEEKQAYETILSLRPQDHETRFKLGTLYFQDGENARGLKVYEELKKANYSKANDLLSIYGREA